MGNANASQERLSFVEDDQDDDKPHKAPDHFLGGSIDATDLVLAKVSRLGIGGRITCIDIEPVYKVLAVASAPTSYKCQRCEVSVNPHRYRFYCRYGGKSVQVVLRPPSPDAVIMVHFMPGQLKLVAVSELSIEQWNWSTGKMLHSLDIDKEYGFNVSCSELSAVYEYRFLVCGLADGKVVVYDCDNKRISGHYVGRHLPPSNRRPDISFAEPTEALRDRRRIYEEEIHDLEVTSVSANPANGNELLIGYTNAYTLLLNLRSSKAHQFYQCGDAVCSLGWNPNGKSFVTGDESGQALVWKKKTSEKPMTSLFPPSESPKFAILQVYWTVPASKDDHGLIIVSGGGGKASSSGTAVSCFSGRDFSALAYYDLPESISRCSHFVIAYKHEQSSLHDEYIPPTVPFVIAATGKDDVHVAHPLCDTVHLLPQLSSPLLLRVVSGEPGVLEWLSDLRRARLRNQRTRNQPRVVSGGSPSSSQSMPTICCTGDVGGNVYFYDFTTPFDADLLFEIRLSSILENSGSMTSEFAQGENIVPSAIHLCTRSRSIVIGCRSGHVILMCYRRTAMSAEDNIQWATCAGMQPPNECGSGFCIRLVLSLHQHPIHALAFDHGINRLVAADTNGMFSLSNIEDGTTLQFLSLSRAVLRRSSSSNEGYSEGDSESSSSGHAEQEMDTRVQVTSILIAENESFDLNGEPLCAVLLLGLSSSITLGFDALTGAPLRANAASPLSPLPDLPSNRFEPPMTQEEITDHIMAGLLGNSESEQNSGPEWFERLDELGSSRKPVLLLGPVDLRASQILIPAPHWSEWNAGAVGIVPNQPRYISPRYYVGVWNATLRICVLDPGFTWKCYHRVRLPATVVAAFLIFRPKVDQSAEDDREGDGYAVVTIDSQRCLRIHRLLDLEELLEVSLDANHRIDMTRCCVTANGRISWITFDHELVTSMLFIEQLRALSAPVLYDPNLHLDTSVSLLSPLFTTLPLPNPKPSSPKNKSKSGLMQSLVNAVSKSTVMDLFGQSIDDATARVSNEAAALKNRLPKLEVETADGDEEHKLEENVASDPIIVLDDKRIGNALNPTDSSGALHTSSAHEMTESAQQNLEKLKETTERSSRLSNAAAEFLSNIQKLSEQQQQQSRSSLG